MSLELDSGLGKQHLQFPLNSLPDSLILQIFSKFTIRERLSLRRVCWKWHHLLSDYSVWRNINLNEEKSLSNKVHVQILEDWVNTWGKTIQEIDASNCKWLTNNAIETVALNCGDLRSLNIEGCFQVSDVAMNEIALNCTRLRKVNVFLSGVSEEGFNQLLRQCPDLEDVKLGSRGNSHRMLLSVCRSVKDLRVISIHDVIPFDESEPVVDDLSLWRLCSRFPGLTAIDLTWCCFITDDALLAIPFCCANLTSFTLRECHQITDRGLRAVFQVCHSKLSRIHLERLYNITDVLCFSPEEMSCLPRLSYLKLIDTSISDLGVAKFAERSPNLETLIVGEHCFNPYNIQGGFISTIATSCARLKRLKVYSGKMKNSYLTAIGENLPFIAELHLGDCRDCTREGLGKIITHCRWLRVLNIRNCAHVTNDTVGFISENLKNLRELEIIHCENVSASTIVEVKRKLPMCTVRC